MGTTDTAKISSAARFYSIKSLTYYGLQTAGGIFRVQFFAVVPIVRFTMGFIFLSLRSLRLISHQTLTLRTPFRYGSLKLNTRRTVVDGVRSFPHYYVRIKNITYCRTCTWACSRGFDLSVLECTHAAMV